MNGIRVYEYVYGVLPVLLHVLVHSYLFLVGMRQLFPCWPFAGGRVQRDGGYWVGSFRRWLGGTGLFRRNASEQAQRARLSHGGGGVPADGVGP